MSCGYFFTYFGNAAMIIILVPANNYFGISRTAGCFEYLFGSLCMKGNKHKGGGEYGKNIFYIAIHVFIICHYKLMSIVLLPVAGLPASMVILPLPFISQES